MKSSPLILFCAALFVFIGGHPCLRAGLTAPLSSPTVTFDLVREGESFTVHLQQPIIPRARLAWLGLAGGIPPEGVSKIPCWLGVNDAGRRPVEVTLDCTGGNLQCFTLPAIFYDLLGRQNIATVLRLAGGVSLPDPIIDSVTPAMMRTVLTAHNFPYDPVANLVTLQLAATTPGARVLVVKIKRPASNQDFKEIAVSFRK